MPAWTPPPLRAHPERAQTTIRVDVARRDGLAQLARELGGVSLDEALKVLLFRHDVSRAVASLEADPAALADYRRQAAALAEVDVAVVDPIW